MEEHLTLQNGKPAKNKKLQQDEQLAVPSCSFLPHILLIEPYPLKQWPSTGNDFAHSGHLAI